MCVIFPTCGQGVGEQKIGIDKSWRACILTESFTSQRCEFISLSLSIYNFLFYFVIVKLGLERGAFHFVDKRIQICNNNWDVH